MTPASLRALSPVQPAHAAGNPSQPDPDPTTVLLLGMVLFVVGAIVWWTSRGRK